MLYDMVWVGFKAHLLQKFKPFTKDNGKFNSNNELGNCAADDEIEFKQYDRQQQKPLG